MGDEKEKEIREKFIGRKIYPILTEEIQHN
jgi:hypothetical protein